MVDEAQKHIDAIDNAITAGIETDIIAALTEAVDYLTKVRVNAERVQHVVKTNSGRITRRRGYGWICTSSSVARIARKVLWPCRYNKTRRTQMTPAINDLPMQLAQKSLRNLEKAVVAHIISGGMYLTRNQLESWCQNYCTDDCSITFIEQPISASRDAEGIMYFNFHFLWNGKPHYTITLAVKQNAAPKSVDYMGTTRTITLSLPE